mgnify:CR=1 FL=1
MKKKLCVFMAAVIASGIATTSLAAEYEEGVLIGSEVSEFADGTVGLFAAIDGISFEYDYAASTELVRVVNVKYDKAYFSNGINSFKVQLNIPDSYVDSVAYTTRLTDFEISDSYSGGVYTCEGKSEVDKTPIDNNLFTLRITLKENILEPITVRLTGDSYLGDSSGTTQSLADGQINSASIEIPANLSDVGDSGVDGVVTWEYSNGVLSLHGNGTMKDYEAGTAPWYKHASKIKSIVFTEDHLQNIGRNAFYGMYAVESVTMSADISAINDNAFEGCSSLRNIEFPSNSNSGIGSRAFKGCSSLTSLYIPDGVVSIGEAAFEGCTRLSSITLPFIGSQRGESNSKNIFSYIFGGNVPSSLKVASITDDSIVPESAFEGCTSVENIYLNDEIRSIGARAFYGCTALDSLDIPAGVTEISDYTFCGCTALRKVSVPASVSAIGTNAFDGCSRLESIYIPPVVTEIRDYTFRGCSSMTSIEIPNSVSMIGTGVLSGCTSLENIKVPFVGANADPGSTSVTDEGIFGYLFGGANTSVPASVTKVEITGEDGYVPKSAFANCGNIVDIIIHGGRSVLDGAFANCRGLKTLYLPSSISVIGDKILEDCVQLQNLTVPFIGFNRRDENTESSVLGGFFGYNDADLNQTMQYYNEDLDYHYYEIPKTLKNVTVLNQTTIPTGAFQECDFIENISVVTAAKMNPFAFYHCASLVKAQLPDDLQSIGEQAFAECESLETINIPSKVKSIGSGVFYGCRNLRNVTMPDSVTEIAEDVFNGTGLYSVPEPGEFMLMDTGLTFTCSEGSKAHEFALANSIAVNLVDSSELERSTAGAYSTLLSTGEYLVNFANTGNYSGTVYAALYSESGELTAVQSKTVTSEDKDSLFIFSAEESENAATAKTFVWGGDNGMVPQTSFAEDEVASDAV